MNLEIFKRNIKLQELGIDKLSDMEQEILDFLNEHLTNLNVYKSNKRLGYIYLGKDKHDIILNYNSKVESLFVHSKIWSFFKSTFNMEYIEIKELIQWWVINTLHLNISYTHNSVTSLPTDDTFI